MGRIDMTYDEVKRRMKNGATVKVIAELNNVTDQAIRAFIKKNEEAEQGIEFMPETEPKLVPKIRVDQDVAEEITNMAVRIHEAIDEHKNQITVLEHKLKQFETIIEALEVIR